MAWLIAEAAKSKDRVLAAKSASPNKRRKTDETFQTAPVRTLADFAFAFIRDMCVAPPDLCAAQGGGERRNFPRRRKRELRHAANGG
mmetsp:Transcript_28486/g.82480  ORF Transcript_28486/g.82480 Transcript_28486/m.82480 type:complete len:87 (+) Transcript_28486:750-1010(+)